MRYLSHLKKLWPGEDVIVVVLHLVVLWETPQICALHSDEVIDLGVGESIGNHFISKVRVGSGRDADIPWLDE